MLKIIETKVNAEDKRDERSNTVNPTKKKIWWRKKENNDVWYTRTKHTSSVLIAPVSSDLVRCFITLQQKDILYNKNETIGKYYTRKSINIRCTGRIRTRIKNKFQWLYKILERTNTYLLYIYWKKKTDDRIEFFQYSFYKTNNICAHYLTEITFKKRKV